MHHFPLARLTSGAQLELVETVTAHLKMRQETAETERENVRLDLAAMPAAVLENTPQDDFGLNLANRRCSERRNVSRSLLTAVGKEAGEAELRRSGTGGQTDKASSWSRNRQVEGADRKIQPDRLTGPNTSSVIG